MVAPFSIRSFQVQSYDTSTTTVPRHNIEVLFVVDAIDWIITVIYLAKPHVLSAALSEQPD